jgi:hypothetical protein
MPPTADLDQEQKFTCHGGQLYIREFFEEGSMHVSYSIYKDQLQNGEIPIKAGQRSALVVCSYR